MFLVYIDDSNCIFLFYSQNTINKSTYNKPHLA